MPAVAAYAYVCLVGSWNFCPDRRNFWANSWLLSNAVPRDSGSRSGASKKVWPSPQSYWPISQVTAFLSHQIRPPCCKVCATDREGGATVAYWSGHKTPYHAWQFLAHSTYLLWTTTLSIGCAQKCYPVDLIFLVKMPLTIRMHVWILKFARHMLSGVASLNDSQSRSIPGTFGALSTIMCTNFGRLLHPKRALHPNFKQSVKQLLSNWRLFLNVQPNWRTHWINYNWSCPHLLNYHGETEAIAGKLEGVNVNHGTNRSETHGGTNTFLIL